MQQEAESALNSHRDDRKTSEELDKEIENHLASIIALKRQKNRNLPISKLPPELLCRIFEAVRGHYMYRMFGTLSLQWIGLSHVSHHWRALAMNTATLWTILPLSNPHWSHEMLTRSKMARLTVDDRSDPASSPLLHNIFLNHMSRVQILKIRLPKKDSSTILAIIPKSAPVLKTLVLTISGRTATATDEYKLSPRALGEMPRIQHLELVGIHIDWEIHLHGNLTTLNLTGTSIPTGLQFWNALERMPLLKILVLRKCLPDVTNASSPRSRLYFKHLNSLTIASTVAKAQNLLQRIDFPESTYISVSCTKGSAPNFSGITKPVALHMHNNNMTLSHLLLVIGTGLHDNLRFKGSYSNHKDRNVTKIEFLVEFSDSSMIENALQDLFKSLHLSGVKSIKILGALNRISIPKIVETFGSLPQLQRLEGDLLGENFVYAMQQVLSMSGQDRPSFPELRELCLNGASFALDDEIEMGDISVDQLRDCFMWRYEYGVALEKLEIKSCFRINGEDISLLEEVVVDVLWDGQELGFPSTEDEEESDTDSWSDGW